MRVNNPNIPYNGAIQGGLKPGMSVFFKGVVHNDIKRFHINLMCQSDIALHFNPRFQGYNGVVLNTRHHNRWAHEERIHQAFQKGEGFELLFIVTSEGYQVDVNGKRIYLFKHRMPVQHVTGLAIAGDVSMETIVIREGDGFLLGKTLNIPYEGAIQGGLKPGMSVFFKGVVHNDIKRFHINLMCQSDIALHFNPRFQAYNGVVFNTRHDNRWAHEERIHQAFQKGEGFELLFIVTSEGYQVDVNGNRIYLFKHRMPVQHVTGLAIAGDVSMETIDIREGEGFLGKTLRIPHLHSINGGLRTGMSLYFKGMVHYDITRFHINLQQGETKALTALHFNPRFKPSQVLVFNTFQNGKWDHEERVTEMPFSKGEIFELVFIVTSEGYQVKVNDHECYLFKHRIPAEQVNFLKIAGDVFIQVVNITEAKAEGLQTCELGPPACAISAPPVKISADVEPIYGGLRPGMSVYFKGTVPKESKRFSINLHCSDVQGCDNAFHFNPRFDSGVVVFNTVRNGSWENEERPHDMPFRKEEDFELLFIITSEGYQVNVNGTAFYLFKHRIPVEDVTAIKIFGDVAIETTNIIEGGKRALQGYLSLGKIVPPRTPYMTTIHGGLREGMYLYFRGTVHREVKRFHINLQCGQETGRSIAFHFNPRFGSAQMVVLNTKQRGKWLKEERVHEMPFRKGESFEILFIVTGKGYQVNVNGRRFYMYLHRLPLKNVNFLSIAGDVSMETIDITGGGKEGIQGYRGLRKMMITKIPHVGPIYGGLRTGIYMYFRGTVPQKMNRFHINLQSGEMKGCDKALHFNPRFKPSEVVVFNTFRNGRWETEERVNKMPFQKGENFELLFIITTVGYQVLINGRQFYLFKHRMPVEQVSAVKIAGDISMQTVNMIRGVQGALEGHPSLGKMVVTKIPHVSPIYGGLRTGMAVFFRGTVPQDIHRFHINLQFGELKGSDKALHFNPRFQPSELVVFNTFRNGRWETEERVTEMPFRKGEDFELVFILTAEGYQVNVNGRRFYLFRHRMPVEHVSAIKIAGDVSMQTINMTEAGKVDKLRHPGLGKMVVNSIPFVGPIHGCLRTGIYMYFRGTVPQEINRFHINLQYGEQKGCDKALHFNPRFKPSEVVVFNTFRNGKWETEERVHQMPFRKGEDFEILFIATQNGYQVIVNGRQFYLFKHRMPVEQVSAIKIAGDISMQTINLIGGGQGHAGQGKMVVTTIPHVGPIYGGLRTGMFIFFRGTVAAEINRFHINLQYGELKGCDKALHFNPRFKPSEMVVFNTFRNGRWETEERVRQMPFRKGEDFEIHFNITPKGFQVNVNGRHFHLFKHRMPVEHVGALKIAGDVSIQTVKITGGEEDDQVGHPGIGRMAITKIPHLGPIYGGLRKGLALHFQGTIPDEIDRFHINLQCGKMDGCDKALHFNPRFKPYEVVVFNTFRKGKWEMEERPSELPFRKGEDFELVIFITSEGYQVYVNGVKFYLFRHRMPVEHVNALNIAGNISMETVDMTEGEPEEAQEHPGLKEILSIPYLKPISGGLRTGMSVYVKGTIPSQSHRFSINLYCEKKDGSDNALHFNPRFDSNLVVFNTFRNGKWENEERVNEMPFSKGEDFELVIIVNLEGYQVNIKGQQFYLFKHRMPLQEVTTLKVFGDVSLQDVHIMKGEQGGIQISPDVGKLADLSIPYLKPISGGLRTGISVYVKGTIPSQSHRFSINLYCGEKDGCDNALHFNPRFDSNLVVFNTFQNGGWKNEERVNEMPFSKGEDFELVIIVNLEGYQVNIKGQQFYLFKHRMPLQKVTALKFFGDVSLQDVHIIEGEQGGIQISPDVGKLADLSIPYLKPISGGLRTGISVYVKGTIPSQSHRFSINLYCGEKDGCDNALHFNPRFDSNLVVFNTFQNGAWKNEERVNEMPFSKGEDFELVIIVNLEGYQVNIKGQQFYLFKHRMPLQEVTALKFFGDVSLQDVHIIELADLSIPYVKPISGGLRTGISVYVKGTIPSQSHRFSINLYCGEKDGCDNALHFNPRFDSNLVVFNTFQNGGWKNEERVNEMPFSKGEDFELVIIVNLEGYQVNIKGQQFYLFKHRMPLQKVTALKFFGDVSLQDVHIIEGEQGGIQISPDVGKLADLSIPYLKPISGGLRTGISVYVKGTIPSQSHRFSINLYCGEKDGCDNALHFNPRFDSNLVVFNTFQNGGWKNEERVNEMPFSKGEDFELVIIVNLEGYQVNIKGQQFYLFKHRMPLQEVTTLKVFGDVSLQDVHIIELADLSIPYVKPISGGLRTGISVYVKGTIPSQSHRFSINLYCGEKDGCDNALHFNPRFDSNLVVFNTFQNGGWKNEERVNEMPFSKGEDFELVIIVNLEGYQVNIKGQQFYLFKHRMPLQKVTTLKVFGDVSLQDVHIIEGEQGGIQISPDVGKLADLSIPYVKPISGGLRTGISVYVKGTIPSQSHRFSINLYCGEKDGCDNALHFNPRFDSNLVVFNTFQNGGWKNEERVNEMPFSKGEDFELVIIVNLEGYQVNIKGQQFYLFKHRMPLQKVTTLKVFGDVSLQDVHIIEGEQGGIQISPDVGKLADLSIPYVKPISGGLRTGISVYVKGTIPSQSHRFSINLYCGEKDGCDNALHFNPRFDSNLVVFNTFQNGGWKNEERVNEMPFSKGEDFELVISVNLEGYQVNIKGQQFYLFKHRMPLQEVTTLKVFGDVSLQDVHIIEGEQGGIQISPDVGKLADLSIPYVKPISGGLRTGISVYVKGTIPSQSHRFSINLYCGEKDGCDNALHFNPRFDSNLVVFNTFQNGGWKNEERVNEMPFSKGEDFELVIIVNLEGYQVNIKGQQFYLFKHRMPLQKVTALKFFGDVSLQEVNIIESIPHVGPIYSYLRTGMSVYFRGMIPQNSNRFSINLHCGEAKGCDNAFHFNPRFAPGLVVFNTVRNGSWENEERVNEMPFRKGEAFELVIIVKSEGYQVNVNGKEFYMFKHRMPVEKVSAIKTFGDVSVQTINLIEGGQEGIQGQLNLGRMVINTIPYRGPIYGGVRQGMYLYFRGKIDDDINRFHINLQCGEKKGSEKALHFNPRFQPSEVVVFNTFRNGQWEKEERVHEMPFIKGESFELVFIVNSKGYQVIVNGRPFHMFKHRLPVEQVSTLAIAGDVSMETFNMIGGGLGRIPRYQGRRKMFVNKIPHVGSIYGGLRTGMYIYFRGTVPQNINRFDINLKYGKTKGCDTALHFNPRFVPSEVVVFNTFRNGSWEQEERPHEMPFRKGEDFEMVFFITSEGYQVNVNGRQFYLFKHRMPVQYVGALTIGGDVSMQTVNTIGGGQRGKGVHPGLGKLAVTKIPHVGPIYGGLRKGMHLYFKGTVPQDIKRFSINLQYGQMKGCDIALHFNPRFEPSEVVVFNTFKNGSWEKEERVDEMPFSKGESFELVFIITSEGYQVNVNGRHFYLFKHRMPVKQVNALKIAGDVSMETADITEGEEIDEPKQQDKEAQQQDKEKEEKKVVPSIPHVGPIYGGLRPGMALYFSGTIPEQINRFSINLHCGDDEGCDNAFHFNPRFDPAEVVVFNTVRNGSWEKEERVEEMPFQPGDSFELVVIVTREGYQVNVNDSEFYLFKHRIPLEDVTAIRIFGDVHIQTAEIIEGGKGAVQGRLGQGQMVVDSIPFVGQIHRGLRTGMYLYFQGKIDDDINRFHINLQCGEKKGCTKALHFNPRFQPSEVVVFNTFQKGRWETEERVKTMPFRKGENFELLFIVTSKGYQVIVNGHQFYMFKHRIPVEQVNALKIAGDVSMKAINMTGAGVQRYRSLRKMVVTRIPHVGPVYGGLRTGMYVYFRGTIPQEINRFHINLQYGELKGCDKALHFNPRFQPSEVVVFNTFRNGRWQKEERVNEMPFRKGEDFELVFIITSDGYQVNVNGRQFYLFKHRMPVQHVSAIKIAGDVSMQTVNMIGGGEGGMPIHPSLGKMVITSIPHVGPVYGGLRTGMFVFFRGTVPQEIKRFHINLQYGELKGCDKALHFNPRFDPSEVVVFNTFRNGSWENEERVDKMPFSKGENFEVVFIITSEGYQVNVNGRQFYLFKHRMPVEQVSAIKIAGDVSMQTVNITEGGKGVVPGVPRLPSAGPVVVSTTPHVEPISGGLRTGMYLYFKGTIPQEIKRFAINMQYGEIKGCDKALHFNPRFDPSEVVVFNSFRNGNWETEERVDEMPFHKGKDFELLFIITSEGYQIYINGRQFYMFKHRMPVEQVTALKIVGDVSVQDINITEGGQALGKIVISKIPHVVPTYGGLRTGMYLYFKGTIPQEIKRFAINLKYGDMKGCDKALHFNPRFDPSEVVVFNSFRNGSWETEERVDKMPFRKGEDFELLFIITSEGYQVNVNGRQFYLFKHRMPVEYVSAIKIAGDVSMQTLNMIEGGQGVEGKIAVNTIPHVGPLYGGLRPGMALSFQGTIPEEIHSFAIILQYGEMKGCDKAFKFNARFEPSEMVTFNSFRNGNWEEEERVNKMPFGPGENFELVFIITSKGYQVIVNGRRFYFFKHRMPVEQVSALKITGNIFIESGNIIPAEEVETQEKPDEKEAEPEAEEVETQEKPDEKEAEPEAEEVETQEKPDEKEAEPEAEEVETQEKPDEKEAEPEAEEVETQEKPDEKEAEPEEKPDEKEEETESNLDEEVIPGGLKTGMAAYFKGTIPNKITSFTISLQCGDSKDSEKALHFKALFEPSEGIVLNSFKDGSWETEERVNEMPFTKGESFELVFHATSEGYQVYVNRRRIYLFKHRIPVEQVCSVQIIGDVSMQTTNYTDFQEEAMQQDTDQDVTEVTTIPGTLKIGTSMSFQGAIPDEITSFSIDLQCGDTDGCDSAFHFSPQFEPSQVVVFNSFKNGSWEEEERVTEMPFHKGESFLLVFILTSDGYQVNVNGSPLYMFKYRMALEQVRAMKFVGDVIQKVNIVETVLIEQQPGQEGKETIQSETPILPGSLKTGMSLSFQGVIPNETNRFSINLQCGDTEGCDTAFHFSPQFETSDVVFNTFQNGSWGTEERVDKMPFSKGEKFDLVYIITSEGYQVNVNGTEFYLFKHRIPVEQVRALQIAGDVSIQTTHIIEGAVQEYPSPANLGTIQCEIPIPGSLKTGMSMTFQGSIPDETNRFSINMQCGDTEGCDTAFHFSPQFETSDVVFNTFQNGSWGTEERVDKMPFSKGEKFELVYIITSEGYQVNVNGQLLYLFKYRMAVEQVTLVQVIGDVSLVNIFITEPTPSVTPLPGGLKMGTSVNFLGTVPNESTGFCIDLQCGEADGCDIVFRFNPEFETSEVLFNSFKNGSWEQEERVTEMPFRKGEDFELVYIVTSEGYQVNVNGQKLYLFKHRIPAEQANALQIIRNVNISSMNIFEGYMGGIGGETVTSGVGELERGDI